ncbi:VOC family protein, partial [Rhodococcoides yunnanense]|uniref:VOC family protein n=1 Tax=Rhodococcoides yunnanense TaxID=278209 RepID=UPI0022C39A50|nr:hypothetical protein [Rhodococcus yunnanensis]
MVGNVTYFEVPSSDIEATQRFWGSLFGWTFRGGNLPGYSMIDGPKPNAVKLAASGAAAEEGASRDARDGAI